MAAKEIAAPEWVFPGAQVVTWCRQNGNESDVRIDTVKNVGAVWITLENLPYRVSTQNLESANQAGGRFSTVIYCIAERYSEQGQRILRDARVRRATGFVARAFEAWQKNPTGETERGDLRVALDHLDNVTTED